MGLAALLSLSSLELVEESKDAPPCPLRTFLCAYVSVSFLIASPTPLCGCGCPKAGGGCCATGPLLQLPLLTIVASLSACSCACVSSLRRCREDLIGKFVLSTSVRCCSFLPLPPFLLPGCYVPTHGSVHYNFFFLFFSLSTQQSKNEEPRVRAYEGTNAHD